MMIPNEVRSGLNLTDLPTRASEVSDGIELLGGRNIRFTCVNRTTRRVCNRFIIGPLSTGSGARLECSKRFPCCRKGRGCYARRGY